MSQKNGKKLSGRKYHNVASLKTEVIEKEEFNRKLYSKKKNLTENNNSNNN